MKKPTLRTRIAAATLAAGAVLGVGAAGSLTNAQPAQAMTYAYSTQINYGGNCWVANVYRTTWWEQTVLRYPTWYTVYQYKVHNGACFRR